MKLVSLSHNKTYLKFKRKKIIEHQEHTNPEEKGIVF